MISVVIPVKDGGEGLARCLAGIRSQKASEEVEIVVIDSGSTDGSLDVARAHEAVVYEIPTRDFSHGASRNLGASRARGELLVFLSQDAVAVDEQWLTRLTAPVLRDDGCAGAYGRQLPNEGATPPESYFLNFLYGPEPRRQRAPTVDELSMNTTLFSNVNSAIPRDIWQRFPFVEDIIMSEDQEWSRRVLLAGFSIAYEPAAAVRHSHNYSMAGAFRRFFDSGASSSRAYMAGARNSSRVLRSSAIDYARGEIRWLWQTGQRRWIPYAALYESAKMVGLLAGVKHERIPLGLKRRLSMMPSYWG
ncbi:MAG: glycosyltransferase [Solirubrobacteraceae bacterium]